MYLLHPISLESIVDFNYVSFVELAWFSLMIIFRFIFWSMLFLLALVFRNIWRNIYSFESYWPILLLLLLLLSPERLSIDTLFFFSLVTKFIFFPTQINRFVVFMNFSKKIPFHHDIIRKRIVLLFNWKYIYVLIHKILYYTLI